MADHRADRDGERRFSVPVIGFTALVLAVISVALVNTASTWVRVAFVAFSYFVLFAMSRRRPSE